MRDRKPSAIDSNLGTHHEPLGLGGEQRRQVPRRIRRLWPRAAVIFSTLALHRHRFTSEADVRDHAGSVRPHQLMRHCLLDKARIINVASFGLRAILGLCATYLPTYYSFSACVTTPLFVQRVSVWSACIFLACVPSLACAPLFFGLCATFRPVRFALACATCLSLWLGLCATTLWYVCYSGQRPLTLLRPVCQPSTGWPAA
jgi:hypothetical protein